MRRRFGRVALRFALLAAGGCEIGDYATAHRAPELLAGLSANDLRLCAGLPERTARGPGGAEFGSSERAVTVGSGSVSLTQVGLSLSGAEEWRATFELRDDRVSRVAFTRMSGAPPSPIAACAPLVETCVDKVRRGLVERIAAP